MPGRLAAESGEPRRSARPCGQPSPGLDIGGVSFLGRLRSVIFLVPRCGLRPFLVVHTSLRQDGFQQECFWEVCWQDIAQPGLTRLLLDPQKSPVRFRQQLLSNAHLTGNSYFETTQASAYYCVFLGVGGRVEVPGNGSLKFLFPPPARRYIRLEIILA